MSLQKQLRLHFQTGLQNMTMRYLVIYQNSDSLQNLSEKEFLQIAQERIQKAFKETRMTRESLDKTLRELSRKRGLQAILENPERFDDLIEDLQLAELIQERKDQDEIEVDFKEL